MKLQIDLNQKKQITTLRSLDVIQLGGIMNKQEK